MNQISIVRRLGLGTAVPAAIPAVGFTIALIALTVFLRLGYNLAEDQGYLYVFLCVLLLPLLGALLVGNARNWTGHQLFLGTVAINFPAALFGLAYLFNMPEVDVKWTPSGNPGGWDPFGSPAGATLSLLFIALQCTSLILNVILLRKIVTTRSISLDPPVSAKGFIKTSRLQPATRSDLLVTGGLLASSGLVALLFGGANAKYYLLVSCAFQLLEIAVFPLFKRALEPGSDVVAIARSKVLEPSKDRRVGVPGRAGLIGGYLLIFLLTITQFIQKNDRGRDIEFMVYSIPYMLFGVAVWFAVSWLLGMWGLNGQSFRYFVTFSLTVIPWGVAFADEARTFDIFQEPMAWLGAGVVIGMCLGGIWDLLWPLPRWNARRSANNFTMFIIIFAAFAEGIVEMYINTTGDDIYLIIFLSITGICAFLGILSSLLVGLAIRRERTVNKAQINPS